MILSIGIISKDEFGPLYVYQISDTMIIDFLNQKRIKYSEEYVKGMYKFFNVILRYAHDHKYTKKNVMDLVPPPPDPRHVGDIVTYNRKELEQMIERIESTRSKIAFQLGLQAGLRESECFALTWSDIDFEKKKIKVCKQLLYQDKQWCFAPLKTVNSYRSVNITAEFAQYLADMKMQHDAERKLYGDGYKRNFVTDRREPKKEEVIEVPDFINVKANAEMLTTTVQSFLPVSSRRTWVSTSSSIICGIPTPQCWRKTDSIPVMCRKCWGIPNWSSLCGTTRTSQRRCLMPQKTH